MVEKSKKIKFKRIGPDTLFLHLKRFDNYGRKLSKFIKFPEKLVFKKVAKDKSVYQLYGVIVHAGGSLGSGHYYAYCKNNGKWYCVKNIFKIIF